MKVPKGNSEGVTAVRNERSGPKFCAATDRIDRYIGYKRSASRKLSGVSPHLNHNI